MIDQDANPNAMMADAASSPKPLPDRFEAMPEGYKNDAVQGVTFSNPAGLTTFVSCDDKGGRTWFAFRHNGVLMRARRGAVSCIDPDIAAQHGLCCVRELPFARCRDDACRAAADALNMAWDPVEVVGWF